MWVLRWIFWVIVLLFIIYFGAENSTQTVYVKFIKWRSPDLQLWIVMYLSFGVGMLVWLFGSIFKVIKLSSEMRKVNKENTALRKELDSLRNISLEDETTEITGFDKELS